MDDQLHKPVLLGEVMSALSPKPGDKYLDTTAGFGGHAAKVAKLIGKNGKLVLIDRDDQAVNYLKESFGSDRRMNIVHDDFYTACKTLLDANERFDCILADIGVSSLQLDESGRGFSFDREGPLDMRMDKRQKKSASDVVNSYPADKLQSILQKYGELSRRQASRLSETIIQNRPITTTKDLVSIIKSHLPGDGKKIESQVFQSIRIEVNDELSQLEKTLPVWAQLLASGGRIAVISFHSLEDRIVKQFFVQHTKNKYEADLKTINKKPIRARAKEKAYNPRARSAKLRAAVKK